MLCAKISFSKLIVKNRDAQRGITNNNKLTLSISI